MDLAYFMSSLNLVISFLLLKDVRDHTWYPPFYLHSHPRERGEMEIVADPKSPKKFHGRTLEQLP